MHDESEAGYLKGIFSNSNLSVKVIALLIIISASHRVPENISIIKS